jgi:ABC-type branched-subunit amino acid transport system substrate-binding protein
MCLAVAAFALAGCPHHFDPSSRPNLPHGGNPAARDRFKQAQALFEKDDYAGAAAQFDALAKEFPDDPIQPQAELYAGMAAFKQGKPDEAEAHLEPIASSPKADDAVRTRARFYLGLSYAAAGKFAPARDLLAPFDGKLDGGDDQIELDAALAASYDGLGDGARALPYYDRFFGAARPAERAHIVARVGAIVDALPDDAARAAYGRASRSGPSAALLGRRVALALCAAGKRDDARRVLEDTAGAREAAGLPPGAGGDAGPGGDAASGVIGVLVPLGGKRRLVGEALLRGVTLVIGAFDPQNAGGATATAGPPLSAEVRDAGESPEQAAHAVDELAQAGAVAFVGPADKDAARAAAERAEAAGLPMISLDVAEVANADASPHVFRLVVPVEARARALARAAVAAGARDFAVLSPDIGYGTRALAAFRDEVDKLGGKVVVTATYAKNATTFIDPVQKIAAVDFDALFIPDTAARLELIAPQLAVANLNAAPPGAKKPRKQRGKSFLLLSTAEALAPSFLSGSARYAAGALLAPGFYPDDTDPRIGAFVRRFRAAFGADPTYLDAYGHDAALCVITALAGGAVGRAGVTEWLGRGTVPGVTGDIRFDTTHQRADDGVLFQVVSDGSGGWLIRAATSAVPKS